MKNRIVFMVISIVVIAILSFGSAIAQDVLPDGKQTVLILDSSAVSLGISARVQIYFCKECGIRPWKGSDTLRIFYVYWYIEKTTNTNQKYRNAYEGYIPDKRFFIYGAIQGIAPKIKNSNPENIFGVIGFVVNTHHLDGKLTVTFVGCKYKDKDEKEKYAFKMTKFFWLNLTKVDIVTTNQSNILALNTN